MSLESSLLAQLQASSQNHPYLKRWVVAYSGGLDSRVLLHATVSANQQLAQPLNIAALHINHQLSPAADEWLKHCAQTASTLGLEFFAEHVAVDNSGQGIEAAARAARYQVFEGFLSAQDMLLMGHHSDDQAETVLLRLMRGSGVLGLTAMPTQRELGNSSLLRPLLNYSRQQLSEYAQEHNLNWVEDESNESDIFDRNYLRHKVMPLLHERWPQANKQLSKAATYLQQTQGLLSDLAQLDLSNLDHRLERCGVSVDWQKARALSPERINNFIRYWCEQQQLSAPDSQQLQQVQEQFFRSNSMLTSALVTWGGSGANGESNNTRVELRQFNQRLYLMPELEKLKPPQEPVTWNSVSDIDMGVAGSLLIDRDDEQGLLLPEKIWQQKVEISWRKGGERCTPAGRSGSQTIKKLLQEYQLETWLRDRVPLIYVDGQLAAVGDLWMCQEFVEDNNHPKISVSWVLN